MDLAERTGQLFAIFESQEFDGLTALLAADGFTGQPVVGGSINGAGSLRVRVSATGDQTAAPPTSKPCTNTTSGAFSGPVSSKAVCPLER